jgi:hypothetical protein
MTTPNSKLTHFRRQQVGKFQITMTRHARRNGPAVYMLGLDGEGINAQFHLGDRSCYETIDDMLDDFMTETPNADLVDPEGQRRLDFPVEYNGEPTYDGPCCHVCGKPADESHTVVGGFVYCSGACSASVAPHA